MLIENNIGSLPSHIDYTNTSVFTQRTEMVNTGNGMIKRINPTMISNVNYNASVSQDINNIDNSMKNVLGINSRVLPHPTHGDTEMTSNKSSQDCTRCKFQKLDSIQTKISKIKLNSFDVDNKNVYFIWENKVYDNYSNVQLLIDTSDILYANKFDNRLVRLQACNNFCFAIYDTQSLLSVFTLFNTLVI